MTTATAERPYTPFAGPSGGSLGAELRKQTAGVRLILGKFGASRILTRDQVGRAAQEFDAQAQMLKASKKLLDTNNPVYRKVTSVLSQARQYWNMMTVEYPIRGIRLIRRSKIAEFDAHMHELRGMLNEALDELDEAYERLREDSRQTLGQLFNESDYPTSIRQQFLISWDYPAIEPPDMLRQLHPDIWEKEQQRVQARFDEAAAAMESAFTEQLNRLVGHLVERLTGDEDGKPKVFRDSMITNFNEFFERFRTISVGSNEQLDALVSQTMALVGGADPKSLRKDGDVRERLATAMAEVQTQLDAMMVDRPNRAISLEDDGE